MDRSKILIYRDQLLPYSETFIPAQVENYQQYEGVYVGSSMLKDSMRLARDRCITLEQTSKFPGIWKSIFKLSGYSSPVWLQTLNALSPKLVHAHFGLDGVLAMPLAKRLRIPLIVTFHGYFATAQPDATFKPQDPFYWRDYIDKRGQFFRQLYFRRRAALFQKANCIVAVSEHIRRSLMAQGCPPEKIYVRYIGVDRQKFQPVNTVDRQPTVLFVGRMVEKKGCAYLLDAIAQLQTRFPSIKLVMIGDGPLRRSFEKLASNSVRECRFLGKQPPHVVREWMARSKVLVSPSVTTSQGETEGLPMVILEAMAMGLPVVASRHAGIPEAVVHNKHGFIVAERDVEALSKAIATLMETPSLWHAFSAAGRKQVASRFDLSANTQRLEELYTQVLEGR